METRSRRRRKVEQKERSEGLGKKIHCIFRNLVNSRNLTAFSSEFSLFLGESIKIIKRRRKPDQVDYRHFSLSLSSLHDGIEFIFKSILLRKQNILINCFQEAQFQLQDLFKFEEQVSEELVKKVTTFYQERIVSFDVRLVDLMLDWIFENIRKKRYEDCEGGNNYNQGRSRKRRRMNYSGWHKQQHPKKEESILYLKILISICKPKKEEKNSYKIYLNKTRTTTSILEDEEEEVEGEAEKGKDLKYLSHSNIDDSEPFLIILRKINQYKVGWLLRQISQSYPNLFSTYGLSSLLSKIGNTSSSDVNNRNPTSPTTTTTVFDLEFFQSLGSTTEIIIIQCLIQNYPHEIKASINSILDSYSQNCQSESSSIEYDSILLFIFCFTLAHRCEGLISLFYDSVIKKIIFFQEEEEGSKVSLMLKNIKSHVFKEDSKFYHSLIQEIINLRINEFFIHEDTEHDELSFLRSMHVSFRYSILKHIQTVLMRMKIISENNTPRPPPQKKRSQIFVFMERLASNNSTLDQIISLFFRQKKNETEKMFWYYLIECLGILKDRFFANSILLKFVLSFDNNNNNNESLRNPKYFTKLVHCFSDLFSSGGEGEDSSFFTSTHLLPQMKLEIKQQQQQSNNNNNNIRRILYFMNQWVKYLSSSNQKEENRRLMDLVFHFCVAQWGYVYGLKFLGQEMSGLVNQLYIALFSDQVRKMKKQDQKIGVSLKSLSFFLVVHFHYLLTPFSKINELEFHGSSDNNNNIYEQKSISLLDSYRREVTFYRRLYPREEMNNNEKTNILNILKMCLLCMSSSSQREADMHIWNVFFQLMFSKLVSFRIHPNGVEWLSDQINYTVYPFHIHSNFLRVFQSSLPQIFNFCFFEETRTRKAENNNNNNNMLYLESLFLGGDGEEESRRKKMKIEDDDEFPQTRRNRVVMNVHSKNILSEEEIRKNELVKLKNEEWILTFIKNLLFSSDDDNNHKMETFSKTFLYYLDVYVEKNQVPPRLKDYEDVMNRKIIQFKYDISIASFFSKYPFLHTSLHLIASKNKKIFTEFFNIGISLMFDVITKWELLHFFDYNRYDEPSLLLLQNSVQNDMKWMKDKEVEKREEIMKWTEKTLSIVVEAQWLPIEKIIKEIHTKVKGTFTYFFVFDSSLLVEVIKKFSNKEIMEILKLYFELMFMYRPTKEMFQFDQEKKEYQRVVISKKGNVRDEEEQEGEGEEEDRKRNEVIQLFNDMIKRYIQKHILEYDKNLIPILF